MARLTICERRKKRDRDVLIAVMCVIRTSNNVIQMYMLMREFFGQRVNCGSHIPFNPNVYQQQIDSLNRLVRSDDTTCHDQLRVNRHTFMRLCHLLMQIGLQDSRDVCVAEKVAIFLWILSHHTKNRRTQFQFLRSGETISRHFNTVLLAVLRLHGVLWFHPEPVLPNDLEDRWKWFENCLRALDGTFIPVLPPAETKARYRSRKGDYATNVLGVCSRNLRFIYALSGWEGSATDSRVLANALVRPHGLKIPHGRFYLVDAGYTNGPGLLAPYRKCVEVDDTTVWEEYERTHKGVSGDEWKAFPMFDDWQTLFGHDRATGEMAEDAPEVPDGTPVHTPGLDDTWNDCYSPRYASGEPLFAEGIFMDVTGDDLNGNVNPSTPRGNVNPSTPRGNPSTPMANIPVPERPKKKAKLDALHEMMKGFITQNNAHMEKLTNAVGFKVNNIIVAGEERLDAFFGIPDHMKQRWENRRPEWLYVYLKGDQNATCGKISLLELYLERFRMAVDDLFVKLGKMIPKPKLQTVFLINNYDMTISVLPVRIEVHLDGEEHWSRTRPNYSRPWDDSSKPVLVLASERCFGGAQSAAQD
ncbi:ribosomal protein PSRP-3/Ycf65 [Actinidia rufa]|uniref:Ribosomal protein PSRP-3/Ycf65 n=1 Tax=Actinidia rufa TaxID=165716 RepID=A0A7J0EQQ2_9ERIC|nr:ribosomal protein PSRP-3/Ycf65 [Actinidia rufa]